MTMLGRRSFESFLLFAAFTGINGFAAGHAAKHRGGVEKPSFKKEQSLKRKNVGRVTAVLWEDPKDISSRNLFYGPGGPQHQPPQGTFTFVEEDLNGTNPKIVVKDRNGVEWTAKLGAEARPETVATRLTWGVGYFADEDYYLQDFKVEGLPAHLHRGGRMIAKDGSMHNVRLKRHLKEETAIGNWTWRANAFDNTRQLNGLRVLMAVISNWDLTDENNKIYEEKPAGSGPAKEIYMISDLGSTFGGGKLTWPLRIGRGDLRAFRHSKFITKTTPEYVSFYNPPRPSAWYLTLPWDFFGKARLRWIGREIPRSDAKWMGDQLGRLSPRQIRDAFRAAGYSPAETEGFAKIVEARIGALQEL